MSENSANQCSFEKGITFKKYREIITSCLLESPAPSIPAEVSTVNTNTMFYISSIKVYIYQFVQLANIRYVEYFFWQVVERA